MEVSNKVKNGLMVTEVLRRCLWEGAGITLVLDGLGEVPEIKLAFPIGSSPHHVTGLHFCLERGQEERPSHSPIIVLPILSRMKQNYYPPKPIHQAILKYFLK